MSSSSSSQHSTGEGTSVDGDTGGVAVGGAAVGMAIGAGVSRSAVDVTVGGTPVGVAVREASRGVTDAGGVCVGEGSLSVGVSSSPCSSVVL